MIANKKGPLSCDPPNSSRGLSWLNTRRQPLYFTRNWNSFAEKQKIFFCKDQDQGQIIPYLWRTHHANTVCHSFSQSLCYIFFGAIRTNSKTPAKTFFIQSLSLKIMSCSLKSKHLGHWTSQCHQNAESLCHCVWMKQLNCLIMLSVNSVLWRDVLM